MDIICLGEPDNRMNNVNDAKIPNIAVKPRPIVFHFICPNSFTTPVNIFNDEANITKLVAVLMLSLPYLATVRKPAKTVSRPVIPTNPLAS